MDSIESASIDMNQQPGHLIRRLHPMSVGMQVVATQPGVDQRRQARAIALAASTTGGVVDRIEARGWLEWRLSPEDAHACCLRLRRVCRD